MCGFYFSFKKLHFNLGVILGLLPLKSYYAAEIYNKLGCTLLIKDTAFCYDLFQKDIKLILYIQIRMH